MILAIYGSGAAGRTIREVAELQGIWTDMIFIDDYEEQGTYKGLERMSYETFTDRYEAADVRVIIAVTEPDIRCVICDRVKNAGYELGNVIHPDAEISVSASVGNGLFMNKGTVIAEGAQVSENVSMDKYVVVGHDCLIGRNVRLSNHVVVSGHTRIGEGSYVAVSVPIKDRVNIGRNVIIGMGSVVINDIPDDVFALGNPARPISKSEGIKLFS